MKRSIAWIAACALALAFACGGDDAKNAADAAKAAGDSASSAAKDMMNQAGSAALDAAKDVAASAGVDPAAACRSLAESGSWGKALDVCQKAHEMMPDDLELEHAYQQAKAAAE